MDNESEMQNADDDKVHEDLLNRAIAPFMTKDGINVPEDCGILVLVEDKAGDIALPFIIPTAEEIDEFVDNFSRFTRLEPTVTPEVMVSGALPDCINDFRAANDNNDDDAWINLTRSAITLLLGLHIQSVDKDKVVTGFSDSRADNTLPVLYGHAEKGMLTTGLIYINREPGKASH
jgi:hypothetical protein